MDQTRMTEFCKMPEEMTLQILSRQPPKSLMRFKCVHKSWCSLINNPIFKTKHLSNSMHYNVDTRLLLKHLVVKDTKTEEKETVFSLLNISNDNDDVEHGIPYVVEDMTKGQFIGFKVLESAWIVGHCDGIICLADLSNVIMLLNPAIMEIKLVTCEPYVPDKTLNLGFGYDPKSKTYKIVNISPLDVESYGYKSIILCPPKIKVYTSCTDSWRQIKTDALETETTNFCLDSFQIYFKGCCYWTGREQLKEYDDEDLDAGNLRQVIILFDMVDEVFYNIPSHHTLCESCFCWYDIHLVVWNDSIALLYLDDDSSHAESLGLWVMADFCGVKSSWTKQFSFEKTVGMATPLQLWNNKEILIYLEEERRLVSYNLDTQKLKYLPIHGIDSDGFQAVAYVTSIVGVIGSNAHVSE